MQLPAEHEENQTIAKYSVVPTKEGEHTSGWVMFVTFLKHNLLQAPLFLSKKWVEAKTNVESATAYEKVKRADAAYEKDVAEAGAIRERTRRDRIDNDLKELTGFAKTQELLERIQQAKSFIEAMGGVVEFNFRDGASVQKIVGQGSVTMRATVASGVGHASSGGQEKVESVEALPSLESKAEIQADSSTVNSKKVTGTMRGSAHASSTASGNLKSKPSKKKPGKKK